MSDAIDLRRKIIGVLLRLRLRAGAPEGMLRNRRQRLDDFTLRGRSQGYHTAAARAAGLR
jgi:hypothetical protein